MDTSPAPLSNPDGAHHTSRNWAGHLALLHGEDAQGYEQLLAQVRRALAPRDVMEEIWASDFVDLVWDIFRLRRMRAHLLKARTKDALGYVLAPLVRTPRNLAEKWWMRDPAAVAEVEAALKRAGLSMDTVMAAALRDDIDRVAQIDTMITNAEMRRGIVLQEIERYRMSFAQTLRHSLEQAEKPALPLAATAAQPPAAPRSGDHDQPA